MNSDIDTAAIATGNDKMIARQDPQILSSKSRMSLPRPPTFENKMEEREYLKFRLAQLLRIFASLGYTEGVDGIVTLRDPILPECFWVNPRSLHFSLAQPCSFLFVKQSGDVVQNHEDTPLFSKDSFTVHAAIYASRADVNCVASVYSMHGVAFSALGRELDMITQDACVFYKDHALYHGRESISNKSCDVGGIITALGRKKALIMQNRGLLVVGPNIEATMRYFMALDKCCYAQLLADQGSAQPKLISDEDASSVHRAIGAPSGGWFRGSVHFAALEEEEGVRFEFTKQ